MTTYRVGWHVNGSGGHRGALGEYIAQLAAGGHRPVVNAVDDAGLAVEIANAGGIAVYRKDQWSAAPDYNVTAQEAARVRWDGIKALIPPEIKAVKDKVVIEVTNEPDRARADWLGRFMKRISELGNADGYAIGGPSFAAGNPEISDWETQGMLDYLHYVGTHADMNAICLHEYSLDSADITTGTPWLVGRYQFMFDVCEAYDLLKPPVIITELGWSYRTMPSSGVMQQIDWAAQLYEHIPVCWWTLGSGSQWGDLPQKLSAYVDDVTQWVLDNSEPEPDEPPPDDDGLWYKSISVLAPQDYTLEQMLELRRRNYEHRRTITQSHDEALQLRKLGQPGSYTIVYDIERWPAEIRAALAAGGHELKTLEPDTLTFTAWPTEYKVVTQLFGANPQNYDEFGLPGHDGVDVRAYMGTPIYAVASGTVTWAGDGQGAYGIYVIVDHGGGWTTAYAHCERVLVATGQQVAGGQQIARADNTGNSEGSHLHLSLKRQGHTYVDGNGVAWPRNYHDPTELLAVFNPQWPGAPPTPSIDTLPYLRGDGRLYEVRNAQGGQERFQTQRQGNIFYQTKNAAWEMLVFDDNYIYRDIDTSPGGGRFYRLLENGVPGSRWIPRFWRIGESYARGRRVQFYDKATCTPQSANSGNVTDTMKFVARYQSYTFRTGIVLPDVIELLWTNGLEKYFYAKNFGLVGWERAHHDPNTPAWSAISEIHSPGERPNNIREIIPCL